MGARDDQSRKSEDQEGGCPESNLTDHMTKEMARHEIEMLSWGGDSRSWTKHACVKRTTNDVTALSMSCGWQCRGEDVSVSSAVAVSSGTWQSASHGGGSVRRQRQGIRRRRRRRAWRFDPSQDTIAMSVNYQDGVVLVRMLDGEDDTDVEPLTSES